MAIRWSLKQKISSQSECYSCKCPKNPFTTSVNYGSPNVAILSKLNIYSLGKIYVQCEHLILIIYGQWKKGNAAVTIFLWWDQMFCFSK